jgi:hypothetical protein
MVFYGFSPFCLIDACLIALSKNPFLNNMNYLTGCGTKTAAEEARRHRRMGGQSTMVMDRLLDLLKREYDRLLVASGYPVS